MTAVSAPEVALPSTPSPCTLFPTESEDYYCLSCHVRCSGLALLVGPHTNHDYLPLHDALLYVPAALLRETREVAQEVEEGFAKPWRVHDRQREDAVHHLVRLRRDKQAAVAKLMAEVQEVDGELLRVTEAKALDVANWRYQHRGLQTRMERLLRGANTLTASYAPPSSSAPSWTHTRQAAQRELAQVRETLRGQLAHMAAEEQACAARLQAWQRLLQELPSSGVDATGVEPPLNRSPSAPTRAAAAAAAGMNFTPVQEPPPLPHLHQQQQQQRYQPRMQTSPPHPSASPAVLPVTAEAQQGAACHGAPVWSAAPLSPTDPAARPAAAELTSAVPLHPSDAEVVLLQHALRNIHDTLRQRLLRAAAASLSTSSSSSTSRSPLSSQRTGSVADATGVTATSLPPLPEATPLRRVPEHDGRLEADWRRAGTTPVEVTGAGMQPPYTPADVPVSRAPHQQQQQGSPLGRPSEVSPQPRWAEASADVGGDGEQQQQQQQWRSWQLREKELKDSLNALLGSGAPPTSSSASFSDLALGHGGLAASAACSSIPVHQRSLGSR